MDLPGLAEVFQIWNEFSRTGTPPEGQRRETRDAWVRAHAYGIDPESPICQTPDLGELRRRRRRRHNLMLAALPGTELLLSTLSVHPYFMSLSDEHGFVLTHWSDAMTAQNMAGLGLVEGVSWSERCLGNNGIGTALATGSPQLVFGWEHFATPLRGWACAGSPIAGRGGRPVGALAVGVPVAHFHPSLLTLCVAAARQAELILPEKTGRRRPAAPNPAAVKAESSLTGQMSAVNATARWIDQLKNLPIWTSAERSTLTDGRAALLKVLALLEPVAS